MYTHPRVQAMCQPQALCKKQTILRAARQQEMDDLFILAECSTNRMQRLSSLPTAPHIGPLSRRQLPSSLHHEHHFLGKYLYQMVLHRPIETAHLIGN
jgi:hypothetical protein